MNKWMNRLLCLAALALAPLAQAGQLLVLSYHEVVQDAPTSDQHAVELRALVQQLEWLKGQGWRFVSLDDVLDDRAGRRALPDKAVLLSFDDGYRSVYTHVFPVLKLFRAPAVIALVGSWLEGPEDGRVPYGRDGAPRSLFLSWEQVREMQASGLVEVASHSYDLHHGIVANPQGNELPAATSYRYRDGGYESHDAFLRRVRDDLAQNVALIRRHTGRAPRVMVWPYGSYTRETNRIAAELGMPTTLTLDDGINDAATPLSALRRMLMGADVSLNDFAYAVRERESWPRGVRPAPSRAMHVDLDYVYDPDPKVQNDNLGRLLDRVKAMGPSAVYLQAFADPDGDGVADALYFPNRHLPVRADLFNRVAWQLKTRTGVRVYAWMPMLGFKLPAANPAAQQQVLALGKDGRPVQQGYLRLSPFSASARAVIRDVYQDLGRAARFDGLLFHDDATLSDFEDASPAALAAYAAWGLPGDVAALRADEARFADWSRRKTAALDDFSRELMDVVRETQPTLLTARNYYAPVVLDARAETWFAQSWQSGLALYDQVAIMAMPYMEGAADPHRWMRQLFDRVAAVPGALDKTVFELQSRDWRNGQPVPADTLVRWVRDLNTWGARHIAYYPDDFYNNQPPLDPMRKAFSMTRLPEK